ncbi:heme-binding protein HMX1 [Podospora aff. communis PSN243]|uniref:Heme-binding protein HMX1 n=1 Tax=Podospora aff. communis PSN243 TaxID=3040156 RepID=A0AAV9GLN0_9PEZI|nr:heme-binding protein HMX1 [Podospora aff. communis PSN243]
MDESAIPTAAGRSRLGDKINTATRSVHARLNKNLILRLPLALPPHTTNPSLYASGLLHIAPIYLVFESLWQNIVHGEDTSPNAPLLDPTALSLFPCEPPETDFTTKTPTPPCPFHIRSLLSHILLPSLTRSPALHDDIQSITGWTAPEVSAQIRLVAQTGRLSAFLAHTKREVSKHPHVLLAYAWVLYMALFSGGRMIRASLEEPGHGFWDCKADPLQPTGRACENPMFDGEGLPLSFFRFATPEDGEDLKAEFKKRLAEAEAQLSGEEIDDVVLEAVCIFDNMMLLVGQLDGVCAGEAGKKKESVDSDDGWVAAIPRFLGGRVRDSLAVARERGLKPFSGIKSEKKEEDVLDLKREKGEEGAAAAEATGVDAMSSSLLSPSVVFVERVPSGDDAEEVSPSSSPGPKAVHFEEDPVLEVLKDERGFEDFRYKLQNVSPVLSMAVLLGLVGVAWGLGRLGW